MIVTMAMLRDAHRDAARHLMQPNPLWVHLKHRALYKLRSRRPWIDRWRADKMGDSRVRAQRLYLPVGFRKISRRP